MSSSWQKRGTTIAELIEQLRSFENQEMEVRVSLDDGDSHSPVYLVGKVDGSCVLFVRSGD
jgi:hypothetical protein